MLAFSSIVSALAAAITTAADEFVIGPNYTVDPVILDHGKPKGRRFNFLLPFGGSHSIFNGSDSCLDPSVPVPSLREIVVNIPAAYEDGDAAPVLVLQDGSLDVPSGAAYILDWVDNAQSNLRDSSDGSRRLPAFITVTVENGAIERNLEYCQMSDRYARFVAEEVLPAVIRDENIRRAYPRISLTADADGRATLGCSSGGAAALTMGYFRPDLFRRIGAYSPSAVDLQYAGTPEVALYPKGAWEYHSDMRLLETEARKPLRVFVSNAENDLYAAGKCPDWVNTTAQAWELNCCSEAFCSDGEHNWAIAGNLTAAALKAAGYEYRHVYTLGQRHCGLLPTDRNVNLWTQTLADALVWMWEGYESLSSQKVYI